MSENHGEISTWASYWTDQFTPWHMPGLGEALKNYGELFLGPSNVGTSILFPLCGKTVDMTLLAGKYNIAGVEGVPAALERYALDNKSTAVKVDQTDLNPWQKFAVELPEVEGKPVVDYYLGDLFALDTVNCRTAVQFDRVFDRGSIVAINPDQRGAYVKVVDSLLKSGSKWMFEAISYEQTQMEGPPHSLTPKMIEDLLADLEKETGAQYELEVLQDLPVTPTSFYTSFLKSNGGELDGYNDIVVIVTKK